MLEQVIEMTEEVSQVSTVSSPANTDEAVKMLHVAMGFLYTNASEMVTEEQARCLRALEDVNSISTATRASVLGRFISGQGYSADADYSPRSWLIHRTRITKGAATAHTAWVRRAAAQAGADQRDLVELAMEIYARSLPANPDDSPDDSFEDRQVRVETTLGGAGVITGDLTPECAAVVTAMLDALSAPVDAEDTRTHGQRYHDALQEGMNRLLASGLLPERAGQPVKAWVHVSLAELRALDDGSVLETEWITAVRVRRASRSDGSLPGRISSQIRPMARLR